MLLTTSWLIALLVALTARLAQSSTWQIVPPASVDIISPMVFVLDALQDASTVISPLSSSLLLAPLAQLICFSTTTDHALLSLLKLVAANFVQLAVNISTAPSSAIYVLLEPSWMVVSASTVQPTVLNVLFPTWVSAPHVFQDIITHQAKSAQSVLNQIVFLAMLWPVLHAWLDGCWVLVWLAWRNVSYLALLVLQLILVYVCHAFLDFCSTLLLLKIVNPTLPAVTMVHALTVHLDLLWWSALTRPNVLHVSHHAPDATLTMKISACLATQDYSSTYLNVFHALLVAPYAHLLPCASNVPQDSSLNKLPLNKVQKWAAILALWVHTPSPV